MSCRMSSVWWLIAASGLFLVASAMPWSSAAAEEPPAPYLVYFAKGNSIDVDALRVSLTKITGVARVEIDRQDRWAKVIAEKDRLLPRRNIVAAAEQLGLRVSSFDVPSWARQVVYDVGTTGGG